MKLAFILGIFFGAQTVLAYSVSHTVTKDETVWFLASVYYAKGEKFPEILKANKLDHPDDIREGMKIQIPEPRFHPEVVHNKETFAERYARLWEKRAKALKERLTASVDDSPLPHSKVVIPTQKIREQDTIQKLPFTEVKDSTISPRERAEKELERTSSNRE